MLLRRLSQSEQTSRRPSGLSKNLTSASDPKVRVQVCVTVNIAWTHIAWTHTAATPSLYLTPKCRVWYCGRSQTRGGVCGEHFLNMTSSTVYENQTKFMLNFLPYYDTLCDVTSCRFTHTVHCSGSRSSAFYNVFKKNLNINEGNKCAVKMLNMKSKSLNILIHH